MSYPKTFIVVRHGETSSNKKDPKRGLVLEGYKQMKNAAKQIKKEADLADAIIIANGIRRSKLSATLLADELNIPVIISSRFMIKMLKKDTARNLLINNPDDLSPGVYYLELAKKGQLENKLFYTPSEILTRFKKNLQLFKNKKTLIFVGHEGSLDTFLKFQNIYKNVSKKDKKAIAYGEVILFTN